MLSQEIKNSRTGEIYQVTGEKKKVKVINFTTCRSTVKGTLISSILAASDKQATANNWIAQVLPL